MGKSQLKNLTDAVKPTLNDTMEIWTSEEKETGKINYGCEIIIENGSYSEVCTKKSPNDAYIVKYYVDNKICFDLSRGTKTNLFDMYWDKFRDNLKSITSGMGIVDPRKIGTKAPESKKRK